ncbi:hypothetical protein FBU30_000995 [Linnemannia zychae]|nr:hypothetical protein FBU30_000995 [Linnemannia zychae]
MLSSEVSAVADTTPGQPQLDTDLTNETNQGENEEGEEGEDWSFYQRNAMPGMLNLPDTTTGRPGFLHLLSGWKNLESLVGSVALDNAETQYTVGVTDMKTMIEQWPKLSHAEFMLHGVMAWENRSEDGEKRPQLALDWLQETYPEFEIILQ